MAGFTSDFQRVGHANLAVLYLVVALEAINSVFGDVGVVNEHGVFISLHPLDVAGMAALLGNIARTGCDVHVALIAGHTDFQVRFVREYKAIMFHFLFGNAVAGCARREGLAPIGSLEVAEETNLFRYRDMFALDDLRVTTGATQSVAPLHSADMYVVIEENVVFEDHLAVCKSLRMTTLLKAHRVVHFGPRPGIIRVGHILQYIG